MSYILTTNLYGQIISFELRVENDDHSYISHVKTKKNHELPAKIHLHTVYII